MLATIVNASPEAAQVFFLVAVIIFAVYAIVAAVARDLMGVLLLSLIHI